MLDPQLTLGRLTETRCRLPIRVKEWSLSASIRARWQGTAMQRRLELCE